MDNQSLLKWIMGIIGSIITGVTIFNFTEENKVEYELDVGNTCVTPIGYCFGNSVNKKFGPQVKGTSCICNINSELVIGEIQ